MGSCNQEIDVSAGSLVWVRRPNGTWWPGRVVGMDELPPGCSKPPRAGTPIKLLGREDGSMDWYNLDKSKRVKTFRCGEYDELIEKAKDRAARASRKSTEERKYVRRDDAILHALELEKAYYFDGNQRLSSAVNGSIITTDKKFGLQSNRYCKKAVYLARAPSSFEKSTQELFGSVVSFEHSDKYTPSGVHLMQRKQRTPNDSEDDATEGMKRMRDLQDLGIGMVLKSHEPNVHLQTQGSSDFDISDGASLSESDFDNEFSGAGTMNSSKDSTSSLKRKESKMVQAYENLRKKTRRRSLQKVWAGSTKTESNLVYHHSDIGGQSIQGVKSKVRDHKTTLEKPYFPSVVDDSPDSSSTSSEENLFDTKENNYIGAIGHSNTQSAAEDRKCSSKLELLANDLSGGFIDVPVVTGVDNESDPSPIFGPCPAARLISRSQKDQSNRCIQVGVVSQVSEGLGDSCSTGSATHVNHARQKIGRGASEWYSKGKRNLRYLSLSKNVDLLESYGHRDHQSDSCLVNRTKKSIMNSTSDESPTSDTSCQLKKCMLLSEVGNVPGERTPKVSSLDDGKHKFAGENGHVYSTDTVNACNSVPCARENGTCLSDEVLGTVMSGRVPLLHRHIRLPSRYRTSDQQGSVGSRLYDVELNVQTSYHGNRVPLVSLMSKLNGKAIIGHPITVEILANGLGSTSSINELLKDKANKGSKSEAKVKRFEQQSGATMFRCPLIKKSSYGKKLGFSPRKIRRLSSFTADNKKEDRRRSVVEKIGGPAVSCIPLRLVFSRLNEALSNSARPAN
ncbi:uncharacterized protein M6B38_386335 [Iris pallida]|uniref:PWWP domain-containing protein n=1 Tax=Iris pallida TaxID=29817 RepID=A0AAX6FBY1_IRIPA|nr:uncharacterized protein M6B38_142675 [Iris pallida]KAJ6823015.1 uncharacterized protein M6B38_386335 [Iris pallida]